MKNLLIIVTLLLMFILSCSKKDRKLDEVNFRNDICYIISEETPYTGKVYDNYKDAKRKMEANYKNGKLDGLRIEWYENGQKKAEENFKNGKLNGLKTIWYESGEKQGEVSFENDVPVGKMKFWRIEKK